MTPTDTAHLVRYLGELFPRWKTNAATLELWVTRLARRTCSIESATLVVEQHRADRKGSDPDLGQIEAKMKACEPQHAPPGRTLAEPARGQPTTHAAFVGEGFRDFCRRHAGDEGWLETLTPPMAQAVVNYGIGRVQAFALPGATALAKKGKK